MGLQVTDNPQSGEKRPNPADFACAVEPNR